MIKTGIFGASGYTGLELARILKRHPQATVVFATSETHSGKRLDDLFPAAPPLPLVAAEEADAREVDVVFLCLPHAAAAPTAMSSLQSGARVVDLSADFRLRDPGEYARWYGADHPAPELLEEAVYGLTEWSREALSAARLVANPGCYPTSVLLPLAPLVQAGVIATDRSVIADSKSGVSGAGRRPKQHTHFVEVAGNFTPYAIGRAHRHLPEMEQVLQSWQTAAQARQGQTAPLRLLFSPHLLPAPRGILSTIYAPLLPWADEDAARRLLTEAYEAEPFVRLLPPGQPASLAHVNHTNCCAIGVVGAGDTLIITSAIDNLVKGASGQAVQNMNVMFGLEETLGLEG